MSSRTPLRIAIDSGGTFTDCVWLSSRAAPPRPSPETSLLSQPRQKRGSRLENPTLRILKVFSTPADPAQAITEAVSKIAGEKQDVIVLHGTTVGTNALLQRKGARVAFVATSGFEDSIEIGR